MLILVEGPSDRGFVRALMAKLGVEGRVLILRGNKPRKAVSLIKACGDEYDKVVLLKDLHRRAESSVEKALSEVRRNAVTQPLG